MQTIVDVDRLTHRAFHIYKFLNEHYLLTGNSFLLGERILNWAVVMNKNQEVVEVMYFRSYNHRVKEQTFLNNIGVFLSSYPIREFEEEGKTIPLERTFNPGEQVPVPELVGQMLAQHK
ncbi:hypothetical protein [Salisediminibacterium halotolerans]|uniref:hypothetical protein n=1 Tax=Salisediminibacterium halotolerans TaxID=517425 RepID=UPI000EAFD599|nr:hypothetical protein [Salisediminibacterium halotolerans]RLJ78338.1 hypothetical protein BCL39_0810 [Actinophytocola xinjiangensis]RPE88323.1 hypothetical protein EDD67_0649 [Salisediminibacterium halotolerans]TWG37314.1 hypothetical protein BCL52_0808 [Salisediminibacterium halotolerans]GEL08889.1 hypothetical protein SHA02_23050 [Salisediminibacterium halotolerans]